MKKLAINIGILVSSLAILLLIFELLVFRLILLPSDLPLLSDQDLSVLKYRPNQTGVYRIKNEISAPFSINSNGWNSTLPGYEKEKDDAERRICIVGDSYVESLQVFPADNFAAVTARELSATFNTVFRFGISGAPLSHYLYMIEKEVIAFSPDILVVNLVHNDFHESWFGGGGTYDESFARFRLSEGGEIRISEPEPYTRDWTWWLKRSATFRYFWVRMKIRPQNVKRLWMQLLGGASNSGQYVANIDVESARDPRIPVGVEYAFSRLKEIEKTNALTVILILDAGNRGFRNRQMTETDGVKAGSVGQMEGIVLDAAKNHGLSIIDLSDVFYDDYQENEIPFAFKHDGHWNSYAHKVVGKRLADFIRKSL
jgi:hypothetical protein